MKGVVALGSVCAVLLTGVVSAYAQTTAGEIQAEVETLFRRSTTHTLTGYVQNVSGSQTYFRWNADTNFIPASTQKLVTTATAYSVYGPQSTFATDTWTGTLATAFKTVNKQSNNPWADATLRHLGKLRSGSNTFAAGAVVSREYLQRIGATDPGFAVSDGSGLSRDNRISSSSVVRLIRDMFTNPTTRSWADTLAIAGVDGTIASRMTGPDTKGRVRAKTGTLRDVIALSGIVDNRYTGRQYLFSFIMNNVGDQATARRTLDRVVTALASNFVDNTTDVEVLSASMSFATPIGRTAANTILSVNAAAEVVRVQYLADNLFVLGESTDRANTFGIGYTFTTPGLRKVTAVGFNSAGAVIGRTTQTVAVGTFPLAIALTASTGDSFTNPAKLQSAAAPGIVRVEYYADGKFLLGQGAPEQPGFPLSYVFQTLGTRQIEARGFTSDGREVRSAVVGVVVK